VYDLDADVFTDKFANGAANAKTHLATNNRTNNPTYTRTDDSRTDDSANWKPDINSVNSPDEGTVEHANAAANGHANLFAHFCAHVATADANSIEAVASSDCRTHCGANNDADVDASGRGSGANAESDDEPVSRTNHTAEFVADSIDDGTSNAVPHSGTDSCHTYPDRNTNTIPHDFPIAAAYIVAVRWTVVWPDECAVSSTNVRGVYQPNAVPYTAPDDASDGEFR
jgi:hypothetical protein